jgi:hypothetical protein
VNGSAVAPFSQGISVAHIVAFSRLSILDEHKYIKTYLRNFNRMFRNSNFGMCQGEHIINLLCKWEEFCAEEKFHERLMRDYEAFFDVLWEGVGSKDNGSKVNGN